MRDLEKLILIGIGVYGVYRAGEQFFGKLDNMDRQGFNVFDVIAAAALGGVLINRINSTRDLLS